MLQRPGSTRQRSTYVKPSKTSCGRRLGLGVCCYFYLQQKSTQWVEFLAAKKNWVEYGSRWIKMIWVDGLGWHFFFLAGLHLATPFGSPNPSYRKFFGARVPEMAWVWWRAFCQGRGWDWQCQTFGVEGTQHGGFEHWRVLPLSAGRSKMRTPCNFDWSKTWKIARTRMHRMWPANSSLLKKTM